MDTLRAIITTALVLGFILGFSYAMYHLVLVPWAEFLTHYYIGPYR